MVWLYLKALSNSYSISSVVSMSSESKFLILESICGIQHRQYRKKKCNNTWPSCFGRKILCRKMLLWHLTKYKVGLFLYSTSCNRSLDYSPQTRSDFTCIRETLWDKATAVKLFFFFFLFIVHYLMLSMIIIWFGKIIWLVNHKWYMDNSSFILNTCFNMCLSKNSSL